jgi:hypothetical protein
VIRPAQQGHEAGCLLEELSQPLRLAGARLLGSHLCGHVAADHEHAADASGRIVLIDG